MTTRTMYVLLSSDEFCTKVKAVHGGEFCYIAPNYTQIYDQEITEILDSNTHCHAIEIKIDDIKEVKNGGALEYYLWIGPNGVRDNERDLATLPITKACSLLTSEQGGGGKNDLPLLVQFAAIISQFSDEDLDAWPNMGKSSIAEWRDRADAIINAHVDAGE